MTTDTYPKPSRQEILDAHTRIVPFIHRTPVLTCETLNRLFGASIWFKCENMQKVGAFKARGAINAVSQLSDDQRKNGVATHSSGNHAQALSWAAGLSGLSAYVVMPVNSSTTKVEAVKDYGGVISFCEPTLEARETTLAAVIAQTGSTEIHPYNNHQVICGQATAALELMEDAGPFDIIMTPVGGGGLLAGTALSVRYFSSGTRVIAAEPSNADDAYRSFVSRTFIPSIRPNTIADGLRTSLGSLTFPIILDHVSAIYTASEQHILAAMKLIWERMKIIIEPSAALPLAVMMENRTAFLNQRIGIILSGGNADLNQIPWIQ